ncbi:MAG TPA: alpha/beta fold hydrolase [Sandaracinaceae bacterium LLY-WYZ-13_1]|nr:alpha/beta fold hydrolase [Sandaracinaceae bacterium LLY-WYZ-13_1]
MGKDAAWRAALGIAVPLLAVGGGALGASIADALAVRSADGRFVAVALGLALPVWVARLLRPGSRLRTRAIVAALGLPWIAAPFAPRSALAVTLLAGGALTLGAEAIGWAGLRAWKLGSTAASRTALAALAVGPFVHLWLSAFVVLFNTQLVVAPVRLAHLDPERLAGERERTLITEDGYRLGATYTPGAPGHPGVVLVHGVADGRSRLVPWARRLRDAGYHVLRFDQRAHGTSEGAVCTYGQREDADVRAAVDALRAIDGVDGERLAVVGASMGGGTLMAAAPTLPRRGVRALVALAPASRYPPLVDQRVAFLGPLAEPVLAGTAHIARAMGQRPMTGWVPADRLDGRLPLLVFHGTADRAIPIALSRRLARRHPRVRLEPVEGVGHVALPAAVTEDEAHWATARDFLETHLASDE